MSDGKENDGDFYCDFRQLYISQAILISFMKKFENKNLFKLLHDKNN